MKHGLGLSVTLVLCAAAEAAAPPAPAPAVQVPATRHEAGKPLDLKVGDIRKYMMPNEFLASINAPDADRNTIVVQGSRVLLPMKSMQPVPGGIIAPFWAIAHPLQSWKILAPDLHAPAFGPTYDKVPPPVFRWGP